MLLRVANPIAQRQNVLWSTRTPTFAKKPPSLIDMLLACPLNFVMYLRSCEGLQAIPKLLLERDVMVNDTSLQGDIQVLLSSHGLQLRLCSSCAAAPCIKICWKRSSWLPV